MKKLLSTVCVVVTAVVMLTPTKTEAQNPTWELYGWDNHKIQYKPVGGMIGLIWRWRTEEVKMIDVYEPGVFADEGHAYKDVYYGYETDNPDHYNYVASAHALTLHHNSGTPRFTNVEDFHVVCGIGSTNNPPKNYPAVEMEGKAYMVGRQIDWISSKRREVHTHYTWIKITAQHTSGGTKNFTLTVTYSVEGSARKTKISTPILLAPGGSTTMRLSVPGNRRWASIVSIDVRENRPLEVPQHPKTAPPVGDSGPPSGRPKQPIVRANSQESSN